ANLRGFANRAGTGCDLRRRCVVPMRRSENFGNVRPAHSETPSMHASSNRIVTPARGVLALALLAVVAALAPAARAQGLRAHATLWARADGDDVKALVEIRIDPGFHLYHGPTAANMGPGDVIGVPTTFEFQGDGITWSPARYPAPVQEPQDTG